MSKYNCAACEDEKQGESVVKKAEHVAKGNVPKYWALCHDHYLRADEKIETSLREDHVNKCCGKPPGWTGGEVKFCDVVIPNGRRFCDRCQLIAIRALTDCIECGGSGCMFCGPTP